MGMFLSGKGVFCCGDVFQLDQEARFLPETLKSLGHVLEIHSPKSFQGLAKSILIPCWEGRIEIHHLKAQHIVQINGFSVT